MITRYYKIYYKNVYVVYVGLTMRTVETRFKEHVRRRHLDTSLYTCKEFYSIQHPKITTLEEFYQQKAIASNLERKFIKDELNKGSHLLNLSGGGEWGYSIYKYFITDEEKIKRNNFKRFYCWLRRWVNHRNTSLFKRWLYNWILHTTTNKSKSWLRHWVVVKDENECKVWLRNWAFNKSRNITKTWLVSFVFSRSRPRVVIWLYHWVAHRKDK